MQTTQSDLLFNRARDLFAGGVNSPVRAFGSVGGTPRFINKAEGAFLVDVDGNRYIDYVQSWGPMVLGHAHPRIVSALTEAIQRGTSYGAPTAQENQLAERIIQLMPNIEMLRFVNSGTEACMSALRLARAYTGREKIVKFAGCYHGHADMLLVQAGSGVATLGLPDSSGVPQSITAHTLVAPYNDLSALESLFKAHGDSIAGVMIEPIAGNMGFILPQEGYLQGIQTLCQNYGALFILDEVMTGFRAALGGVQSLLGLQPDIVCLGKVIGGGLPVGAYGGKKDIMRHVAPAGTMYQAGTLSGNPLAMTAGITTLDLLAETGTFDAIATQTTTFTDGLRTVSDETQTPMQVASMGTMFGFYFLNDTTATISDFSSAKQYADTATYATFFHAMLEHGIYLAPSQFEAGFVSLAHTSEVIQQTLDTLKTVMPNLHSPI
jgi:glutamate-1-semialdehyde 2,1-aminomutase